MTNLDRRLIAGWILAAAAVLFVLTSALLFFVATARADTSAWIPHAEGCQSHGVHEAKLQCFRH